jgi:tetratricopeptide (TPR) repeat protein
MKKLFFIALMLGTTAFVGIFGYSYIRLKNRAPEAYSETGKKYYDQGKYSDAILQFINAIRRNGNDRDSRYYLALSYLSLPDLGAGVNQLRKLLAIFPDDVEANLKLGNIYLQGGADPKFYEEAQKLAERVLAKDSKNVQALILQANSMAGLKKFDEALNVLKQATDLEPKNVSAWVSLGSLHLQRKDLKEAEKAFLTARSSDETSKSAVVSLASFYRLAGNSEKAEQILKDALARFPADRAISNQMSDFYLRSGRSDDAEKVLRTAAAAGKDPLPTLDLAEFFSSQNRRADARKVLLEAKSRFPESTELAIKIAQNLLIDKPEQAKQEIDRVLKAEPYNPAGYILLGEYQYSVGQYPEAAATLGKEPAISSPTPQVHYLLGKISMRNGKADEAQTHLEQSARMNDRYLAPKIALAELFIAKGQYSDARQQVQQTLKIDSRNTSARLMNATLDSINRNYVAAEKEYSALLRENPNDADIHHQIARSEMTRGRTNEAEKSFLRALELAPQSEQLFAELISFYGLTKQTERAMQKLNTIPDSEKTAFHYELIGMTAEQAGKIPDAESAYRKALEKDSQRINVHTRLFNLYLRTGRQEEAERTLDVLAEKHPAKNVVYAMKGSLQSSRGDSPGAEQSYKAALALDPQTDVAANNLAYLLADEGRDLTTALQMAQDVKSRHPEDPTIADTLGWIYFKLDLIPQAKTQAEFAVSKRPENGEAQYHLGEIYRKNSEFAKAEAAFKKAVSSPASSPQQLKQKDLAATALKEVQKILATKK